MRWLKPAMALVFPDVCQICEQESATKKQGYVGDRCWQGLKFIKPPLCERCGVPFAGEITQRFECANCKELDLAFTWARSSVAAEGVAMEAIHKFKYNRALWFEPFLVDLWVRGAQEMLATEPFDLLIPVPLHPQKQREREFNQAERLVRGIARQTGLKTGVNFVKRITATRTQTRLDRKARAANVKGAFAMRKGLKLNGERVLLVDDVLTTGATTSACARALLDGGAGVVCVWTVARGL